MGAFLKAMEHGFTAWGVWRDLGLSAAAIRDLSLLARACGELEKGRPAEAAMLRQRLEELRASRAKRRVRARRWPDRGRRLVDWEEVANPGG